MRNAYQRRAAARALPYRVRRRLRPRLTRAWPGPTRKSSIAPAVPRACCASRLARAHGAARARRGARGRRAGGGALVSIARIEDDDRMETRLVGQTLAGRYDLIELLGTGGMGEVYRARDRELDELVALKLIRADLASAPDIVAKFRHEVKLARRVTHGNVARTFELGWADGLMFCTMQLIDGESLARRLARERRLEADEAVAIACELCEALIAAHAADVIHRDIKPANVLLARDGRVVLADFGIAAVRIADDADISGTPAYMAPEQARGEPPTPAADVYAVGVLLYEMVLGRRAFLGNPAAIFDAKQQVDHLIPAGVDLPPGLAEVIGRATARELADRIATAAELRAALAPWRRSAVPPPPRPSARPAAEVILERTVLVVAPRPAADEALMPVAEAIHEELLGVLARGRLRVLSRAEGGEPADVVLRFAVGDGRTPKAMAMTATRAGEDAPAVTLQLPLEIEHVARSVALAARAVDALFAKAPAQPNDEAYELLVRARHEARRGPSHFRQPLALLERAHALRPHDARIRAMLALMIVRGAFFSRDPSLLERAADHVRTALATGPGLVEAHLAAGHLEQQVGDPAEAAAHYRVAIACAPHSPEAHDLLGRMLLEAGYLDAALARLEHAMAISPDFRTVEWEIARAMALEQRWDEHERILARNHSDRPIARMRMLWWRGRLDEVRARRAAGALSDVFDPELFEMMLAALLDGAWGRVRAPLIATAEDRSWPSQRRRAFVAQVVAEIAGHVGDVDACNRVLAHAARYARLFDLHWLDRCPMLASARGTPAFATVREQIQARSRAIYDALYGDHPIGHGETAPATS
jgi:tetratricopeptide (TPR) repeat protein